MGADVDPSSDADPDPIFVSVTRLRLRSVRFLPAFLLHAARVNRQVAAAPGYRGGALLADRARTFWTLTTWDDAAAMRAFMAAGAHRDVMPWLARWCDQASVVHWTQAGPALPGWDEAAARMRAEGRPSPLAHPDPGHAALAFAPPRTGLGRPIPPRS